MRKQQQAKVRRCGLDHNQVQAIGYVIVLHLSLMFIPTKLAFKEK